jgi:hypothetical protein
MEFVITKIGAEPFNRFLAITKLGDLWTELFRATRFETLVEANRFAESRESVRILWLDESHPAKWGEVVGQFPVVR